MKLLREKRGVSKGKGEASLLDLKVEIARRMLSECLLCGNRCKVDRLQGDLGACLLGPEAVVAEHFVQIAEESLINPSLMVHLLGAGLGVVSASSFCFWILFLWMARACSGALG